MAEDIDQQLRRIQRKLDTYEGYLHKINAGVENLSGKATAKNHRGETIARVHTVEEMMEHVLKDVAQEMEYETIPTIRDVERRCWTAGGSFGWALVKEAINQLVKDDKLLKFTQPNERTQRFILVTSIFNSSTRWLDLVAKRNLRILNPRPPIGPEQNLLLSEDVKEY